METIKKVELVPDHMADLVKKTKKFMVVHIVAEIVYLVFVR